MEQEDINTLIEKYIAGTASPEEENLLLQWYRSRSNNTAEVEVNSKGEPKHIKERILLRLHKNIYETKPSVIRKLNIRKRIAIAASFLLIFSLAGYLWLQKPALVKIADTAVQMQDISAGTNKATLTLADGSKIILDRAATGTLAQQGNTHITKLGDGTVAYKTDSYDEPRIALQQFNVLTTPRGGQFALTLPDGSRVWLNAASSLKFPIAFTEKERLVELTGEAYFEVAKNAAKPFKVTVNGAEVEALGTIFNILSYSDEATQRMTLVEGKVKVSHADQSVILKPGQQASIANNGSIQSGNVNTGEVIAWKEGLFQFENTDMEAIMRQLSRWYDVDVTFGSKISGTFSATIERSEPISKVFKMLEFSGRVKFHIDKNTVIVAAQKSE